MVKRRLNYELTDDKRRKRTTDTNKTSKNFFCIILIILVSIGLTTAFLGSREGNYQLFTLMLIGLGASFIGILAGGGGLITVLGMMLTGIPIQTRIATNKFSSGIAALSSVFYLIRNKQLNVHSLLITILIAVLGGIGEALVTTNIQEEKMNIIAFALLCFALIVTIKNKQWTATIQQDKKQKQQRKDYTSLSLLQHMMGGIWTRIRHI